MTAQGLCEAAGSILRAGVKVQQALAKVAVLYGCGNLSAGAVLSKCAADLRQNGGDNDWSRIVSMVIMVTPLPALADHILEVETRNVSPPAVRWYDLPQRSGPEFGRRSEARICHRRRPETP